MKLLGVLGLLAILTGCSNTPTELIDEPSSYDGSIQVDLTPQQAYRNLRQATKICLEHSPMGTPVTTESEFDSDLQSGEITQRMIAQGVRLSLAIIRIEPTTAHGSEVKLYTVKGWNSIGIKSPTVEQLRRWLKGDKSC